MNRRCLSKSPLHRILLALLFLLFVGSTFGQTRPPNLVVLIVAEQFRGDYLDLYRPAFSKGGFERLLAEGAVYRRSRFDHYTTLAAPNAAILATGAYPQVHGIVASRWFDRKAERVVDAVGADETGAGPAGDSVSPRFLKASTFADELRLATAGGSRVVAISGGPAPAILLAGRSPLGCYWMGPDGRFQTSAHYTQALPSWVNEFNTLHSAAQYQNRPWAALRAPADAAPLRVLRGSDSADLIGFRALYQSSPFAAAETLAFAFRAIEAERLGLGTYPDLLVVNLSAPALLGLETGSQSPLMRDMVLRLDGLLAQFLAAVDGHLGLEKAAVVFTASHGLPPLPEEAGRMGMPSGRVSGEEVAALMNNALKDSFGSDVFVEKYVYPFAYLNRKAREQPIESRRRMIEVAGDAALQVDGVAGYYSPDAARIPPSFRERLEKTWHPPRSGDFMLVYDPYFVESYGDGRGTASGSLYRYDTDVPLIFLGKHFRAAQFVAAVDAASVAPTLSAVLGIPAPSSSSGKVLAEAWRSGPHAGGGKKDPEASPPSR